MTKPSFPSTGDARLDKALRWLLRRSSPMRGQGCPTRYFEGEAPPKLVKDIRAHLSPQHARAKDTGREVVYYWGGMPQGACFAFHHGGTLETRNRVRFVASDLRRAAEWRSMLGSRL